MEELSSTDIYCRLKHNLDNNPNENYEIMSNIIQNAKAKHVPSRFVKYNKHRHKGNKWITYGIINSIKARDKMHLKLTCTSATSNAYPILKHNLGVFNSILKKAIREAKISYYNMMFEKYKYDIKNTWKTISEVLSKAKREKNTIEEIIVNGNSVKSKQNIANEFNIFFTNIGPNLANNIDTNNKRTYTSYLTNASTSNFYFSPISQDDVSKTIASLRSKSSFGHYGMSKKFLKTLVPVLLRPLTLIINQSLTTGIFPDQLKIAKVLPIHKKMKLQQWTTIDQYHYYQLYLKFLKRQLTFNYLIVFTQNKLFYHSQYGFREDHSTELAALELVDRIHLDLDKRKYPITIYMDLSKAFDTLDHNILLNKLKYYGVKNTELSWFQSYLTERSQYVEINGIPSNVLTISTGVPQGSILGALIFLIYMNDIPEVSIFFKYILYADDTSLLNSLSISLNSYDPDIHTINLELSKIYDWLAVNKLSLNLRKTKYILFHHHNKKLPNNISLQINSTEIERVTNFIFLGVTINEHLSWKPHIDKICSKISKYIGILNKLKHYLPQNILSILYCSVVQSHLSYAILTWGFDCGREVNLQKKSIRIIACSRYNAHTEPIII